MSYHAGARSPPLALLAALLLGGCPSDSKPSDTGAGDDTDTAADTGSDSDTAADTGTDTASDTDTAADTDTAVDTDTAADTSSDCPGTGTLTATDADNGGTVSVVAGTKVAIEVADPYGDGGWSWWLVDAGGLGGGDETTGSSSDTGAGGSYPPETFTFTTDGLATGTYGVTLMYGRSWDKTTWTPYMLSVSVTGC